MGRAKEGYILIPVLEQDVLTLGEEDDQVDCSDGARVKEGARMV